ncbi:unnamed protein product, partial [Symbiodinium sp. CCMP2592]
ENQNKLKVVTRSARQRQLLRAKGIQPSAEATVLGTPFREDGLLEVAGPRLDKFQALLRRLGCLPVVSCVKHRLYRTVIIPQLLWSFWWSPCSAADLQDQQKLTTNVKRALDVVQQGSRDLWLLLAGHWMDVGFALRLASASAFFAADAFWREQGRRLVIGRWGQSVGSFLQELQFTRTGAHAWQHAVAGAFDLSAGDLPARNKARHLMREAWRRQRYASFLRGQRHELDDLIPDDEGYSETVLKAAIKLYNGASNEERHVMLGGCVSEEQYARMHKLPPQGAGSFLLRCTLCGRTGVPNWWHAAWCCSYFASSRPATPTSSWAWRLGWPLRGERHADVRERLRHLGLVRAAVRGQFGFRPPGRRQLEVT